MRKIIVSGFTASGKSSLARALAAALSIPVFFGSELRADFLNLGAGRLRPRSYWARDPEALESEQVRMDPSKSGDEVAFDQWHADFYGASAEGVFDAWFLAW